MIPNETPTDGSITTRAIAAYESGDIESARRLLTQAVKEEPNNPDAWWYMSKVQVDAERRLQCLRRVIRLNPDHAQAAAEMTALEQTVQAQMSAEEEQIRAEVKRPVPTSAQNAAAFGIPVPPGIDGAPLKVSFNDTFAFLSDKVGEAMGLLKAPSAAVEATRASWWQIVFMAFLVGLISGLVTLVIVMLTSFRLLTITSPIAIPLYSVITALVGVGGACIASHWYITRVRGGQASLLAHSYPLTLIWAVASIVHLVFIVISDLLGGSILTLRSWLSYGMFSSFGDSLLFTGISLAILLGTAYLMVNQLARLYPAVSQAQRWITALIYLFIVGTIF